MNKLKLFQYAVLLHKTEVKDGKTEYVGSELIVEPKTVLAKNEKEVLFKATREVPESAASDPDNVEILVRPF